MMTAQPFAGATTYEFYMNTVDGNDNNSYELVSSGESPSQEIAIRDTVGFQYFKYKVCFTPDLCSKFSPYSQVNAYTSPGNPGEVTVLSHEVDVNEAFDVSFTSANGTVDGAIYSLQESINGGAFSTVCEKTRMSHSEQNYTCSIAGKSLVGSYNYRVIVCNPQDVGCGGYTTISAPVKVLPATPTTHPEIPESHYQPIGNKVMMTAQSFAGATTYEFYMNTVDGNDNNFYELVSSGESPSQEIAIRDTVGFQYFKYKVCFSPDLCSKFSPYSQVNAYTYPFNPGEITVLSHEVDVNEAFDVSFTSANGTVDGAIYSLQESVNGGAFSTVCEKTRMNHSEKNYTCSIAGKSLAGSYNYRVIVCNPKDVGCSGYTTISAPVVVSSNGLIKSIRIELIGKSHKDNVVE